MTERKLRSRSFSIVRDVDKIGQETPFTETEASDTGKETELDRGIVEVDEEINSVTDRQIKPSSDSSNTSVMSARQFQKFISTVQKCLEI
jgi:hypothetical protein